jgi:hypothetical protein
MMYFCRAHRRADPPQRHGDREAQLRQKGCLLFAALNVTQLVGWTAIMIYDSSLAAAGIFSGGAWIWCLVIGALIALWIRHRHAKISAS